jgi:uncharacterized repeat protein (TIGR03803 family)
LLIHLLLAGLGAVLAGQAAAQTFSTLHSFTAVDLETNSDGATPYYVGLVLSDNILYGTTALGGTNSNGTVFGVSTGPNGTFTTLYSFTPANGSDYTNSDGADPNAGLLLAGDTLYGTATYGGTNGNGTVFAVSTNGTGFATLHNFSALVAGTNSDGANPVCNLVLSGNALYGTTTAGGTNGVGTVFAINVDGTGFATLHTFAAASTNAEGFYTNSDGTGPNSLIVSGNVLYGTAYAGSTNGSGTVFAINTDGSGFTTLYPFSALVSGTNSDGASPVSSLILSSNMLYGTAAFGGTNGNGTVFAVKADGTSFTTLYSFTATIGSESLNPDGADPESALILSGNTLYGTTFYGGTNGSGTVFAVNTNGTGFATLHTFEAASGDEATNGDGADPNAPLVLSGNTLYGTTTAGGLHGNGAVFSLSYPSPPLAINPSGTNVSVTWPGGVGGFSYSGYTLQSSTNLNLPSAWSNVPALPVVVSGQNNVTNPVSGQQMLFRLIE